MIMSKIVFLICVASSGIMAMSSATKYSTDGLEIRWVSACRDQVDTKIECPYGGLVRVLELIDGTKKSNCLKNCCLFNKTTDCFKVSTYVFLQRDICMNKTECDIFQSGGITLSCGITSFAAVSFVCEGGAGPTTTESTTTESRSTNLPREGGIKSDETNLGLALGLFFGCALLLCLILMVVIYLRYYRGKKNFQRASKTPPPVTQLGIKIDKSQAPVNSASRPKLDKGLFKTGSWSQTGYQQFGIPGHNPNMSNSFVSPGNFWKQASWLSAVNHYSQFPGALQNHQPKYAGFQQGTNPYDKGYEEDVNSLGSADDLNALPDISMFSIPESRTSPDSGVDNIGYIFPVIKEQPRDDDLGHLEERNPTANTREYDDNKGQDSTMLFQPEPHYVNQDHQIPTVMVPKQSDQQPFALNRNYSDVMISPEATLQQNSDNLETETGTFSDGSFSQMGQHDAVLY